ncbi:MAG: uncharacterized protein A8A55_0226 [Amphiamblys sp. WSBS2006]|nr:MAG: uncharacterized protein A8A55_0226 [Amphiamblys sp. WSBS2006]
MDAFGEELALIKRMLYRMKNRHGNTVYFRKLVYVKRILEKLGNTAQKTPLLRKLEQETAACYLHYRALLQNSFFFQVALVVCALMGKVAFLVSALLPATE